MKQPSLHPAIGQLVQDFFCKNLINQRNVSPRTVTAYRDTFRLLLQYASKQQGKQPVDLTLDDLNAATIARFLDHLEKDRNNSIRTRNLRLAAIRSFMHYAAYQEPAALSLIQRVLAIPQKRFHRPVLGFLSREEIEAILDAPDPSTWSGRRDRVLFATLYNTGARVSEIISLLVSDLTLDRSSSVRINGKGRKQRMVPLWKSTATRLREWLKSIPHDLESILFPNRFGKALTASGVEYRLKALIKKASQACSTLKERRRISPHTIRHSTATHLLQAGVDLSVISLWLGHEEMSTTHLYLAADLKMKERALKKLEETPTRPLRYQAGDKLLRFLEGL
jgi:site-specific recombinase XerD